MTKKIFIFLVTIIAGADANAQLQEMEPSKAQWVTVGEIKWLANTKASLKYLVNTRDTVYLLRLQDEQKLKNNRDMTVNQYFSIDFKETGNTLNKFYDLLISFFNHENKNNKQYEKTFRLGNEALIVRHFPKLTARAIVMATTKNSIVLTEKEVKKLFNRK